MLNSLKKFLLFWSFFSLGIPKMSPFVDKISCWSRGANIFFLKPSLHTETDISVSYILFQGELQFCQAKAQGLSFGNNG